MRRLIHLSLLFAALLATGATMAQSVGLVEANRMYQSGDLPGARAVLDELVKQPGSEKSPEAWVLRGFVYKDVYKSMAPGPQADVVRDEALRSLMVCMQADSTKEFQQSSQQAYDFLCKTIYNDAARALNEMDHARAESLYANYKECVRRMEKDRNFKERDIEFSNALGTVLTKRYNQNREDTTWFDKAVAVYKAVLDTDPENYGANYNLATLYYNRGVFAIQRISVGTTIADLDDIQRVAKRFFMLALPYMQKAHEMNPKRRETLLGLEGIHYSLQDADKSEEFRHKYEALDQGTPPPDPEAPKDK